ncbi:TIGR00266 family protein, partial [Candidatus Bathyarchaeota archaeon]
MRYSVKYGPSYSMLVVDLEAGERITGEAGALTYMTPNIDVETRLRERGILGSLGL